MVVVVAAAEAAAVEAVASSSPPIAPLAAPALGEGKWGGGLVSKCGGVGDSPKPCRAASRVGLTLLLLLVLLLLLLLVVVMCAGEPFAGLAVCAVAAGRGR